jgi:SAM-dependent methyltransferase
VDHATLLPRTGRALDVACGAGRHTIFLAEQGLEVVGVDISSVGLEIARSNAHARGLGSRVQLYELDLTRDLPDGVFDVVVCLHYLERTIFDGLAKRLKPGGLLLFETFTRDQLAFPEAHPRRDAFLLAPNELLHAFPSLCVVEYSEKEERLSDGRRAVLARLVARRRA